MHGDMLQNYVCTGGYKECLIHTSSLRHNSPLLTEAEFHRFICDYLRIFRAGKDYII